MTIEKAIEILCDLQTGVIPPDPHDMFDALSLGEQACRRIVYMREADIAQAHQYFKGERELQRFVPDVRD